MDANHEGDDVQDFNLREVANSLWAMTTASRVLPEACDSLCYAAAAKVLGVSGSGSEGEGVHRARPRQPAVGHSHAGLGPACGL